MTNDLGEFIAENTARHVRTATCVKGLRGGYGKNNPMAFEFDYLNPSNKLTVYAGIELKFEFDKSSRSIEIYVGDSLQDSTLKKKVLDRLDQYWTGSMFKGNRWILPLSENEQKVVEEVRPVEDSVIVILKRKSNTQGRTLSDERVFKAVYKAGVAPILQTILDCREKN